MIRQAISRLYVRIITIIFIWSGSQLYPVVDLYIPENCEDVPAITFADSITTLRNVLKEEILDPKDKLPTGDREHA